MSQKGFIYSEQLALFGGRSVIGFGDESFAVKIIDTSVANNVIRANHYSKKTYPCSTLHFGIFAPNALLGVLQFGFAMNPASQASVVSGTERNEYLELNRMWLDDALPRNSESKAISYAIKAIRRIQPSVKWIQSFADERCKGFGIVYQACNFSYYGEHVSVFWELEGQMYHNIQMTAQKRKTGGSGQFLQENKDKAIKHELRQFRYIYFIDKRCKKDCLHKELPYPKHYKEEVAEAGWPEVEV